MHLQMTCSVFPQNKILDKSKFKAFADKNFNIAQMKESGFYSYKTVFQLYRGGQ